MTDMWELFQHAIPFQTFPNGERNNFTFLNVNREFILRTSDRLPSQPDNSTPPRATRQSQYATLKAQVISSILHVHCLAAVKQ